MYILISILVFLMILLVLLSLYNVKIIFEFDSQENNNFDFIIYWLYPLFKGVVTKKNNKFIITVYLFSKKVLTKPLNNRNNKTAFNLIKSIKFDYIKLKTSYGFRNPAITGLVCASIELISTFISAKNLYNDPSFSMDSDYISLDAETEINMITTIKNIMRFKVYSLSNKRLLSVR